MDNSQYILTNTNTASLSIEDYWTEVKSYRFHILILKEDDGTFSIIALNLPGVGSIGDTEDEALANFQEAALGAFESYAASGDKIPWKSTPGDDDIPVGARRQWILVHV